MGNQKPEKSTFQGVMAGSGAETEIPNATPCLIRSGGKGSERLGHFLRVTEQKKILGSSHPCPAHPGLLWTPHQKESKGEHGMGAEFVVTANSAWETQARSFPKPSPSRPAFPLFPGYSLLSVPEFSWLSA